MYAELKSNYKWICIILFIITSLFIICTISGACKCRYVKELPPNTEHPRLLLSNDEFDLLINSHQDSIAFNEVNSEIVRYCNKLLDLPPLERKLKGIRLLDVSREALKRLFYLSYSYRLTGKVEYESRGIEELRTICSFEDWNPKHFLDVGEMALAAAIGIDWLWNSISDEEKTKFAAAIKEKALDPSLEKGWDRFKRLDNNWNSVCNAGLLFASIAVSDFYPELSLEVINECITSNFKAVEKYGPDGGYPEGYMYWDYGTTFQVLLIDALLKSFGSDFGLSDREGFRNSGNYIQFMVAPSGQPFNFSDCADGAIANIPLWWFAWINDDTSLLYLIKSSVNKKGIKLPIRSRLAPLIPIFVSRLNKAIRIPERRIWFSKGETPVFIYRSGWDKSDDTYLGVKGGSPKTPHAHMDGGSFVYEFGGKRWATDLGMPDYYQLEKQGIRLWDGRQDGQRWDIMKMRNDCHNTLTIDSMRHNVNGVAEIVDTYQSESRKGALLDLTSLFNGIKKVRREVSLDQNDYLVIRDSITTIDKALNLNWIMVTEATAQIDNGDIILRQGDQSMTLSIKSPVKFKPQIWSMDPMHNYDQPNGKKLRVGFNAEIPSDMETFFEVTLRPTF